MIRFALVLSLFTLTATALAAEPNGVRPRPLEVAEVLRLEPTKFAQLLRDAQDAIEITPQLDGVWISDGKLHPADEPGVRRLTLSGRIRKAEQRAVVAQVVADVLQNESFFATQDEEIVVVADALEIAAPLSEAGKKSYNLAIEHFFAGQYAEADAMFTRALVEDPQREAIQYWKAVTAIALKQSDRAEKRLTALLRRNPAGSRPYAKDMERLQGPLRQTLLQMEQKVSLKLRSGT